MSQCHNQKLILLTSPPASGKTYWIGELAQVVSYTPILVLSPLRALADECREKWGERIQVMTPEEWLFKKTDHRIVIFDECHLLFYWGDSFRHRMWDAFYEIAERVEMMFFLTATFSPTMQKEIEKFSVHFDELWWVDCGNQKLKFKPKSYVKAPDKNWLEEHIFSQQKQSEVRLIFCQYRQEVRIWEEKLRAKNYSVVSCVGGEAKYMKDKLMQTPKPDFIVSTTVLSHGVNLPEVSAVYFLYKVNNLDFWIQMVARGGRRGGAFKVYALETPCGVKWSIGINLVRVYWFKFKRWLSIGRLLEELTEL